MPASLPDTASYLGKSTCHLHLKPHWSASIFHNYFSQFCLKICIAFQIHTSARSSAPSQQHVMSSVHDPLSMKRQVGDISCVSMANCRKWPNNHPASNNRPLKLEGAFLSFSFHFTIFIFISFYNIHLHFILQYSFSFHFTMFIFISFYNIYFHFILQYSFSFHFTTFIFISFYNFYTGYKFHIGYVFKPNCLNGNTNIKNKRS